MAVRLFRLYDLCNLPLRLNHGSDSNEEVVLCQKYSVYRTAVGNANII